MSRLSQKLKEYPHSIQTQVRERLKGYLLRIENDITIRGNINSGTLDECLTRIRDYDESNLFKLFNTLAKDQKLQQKIRGLFREILYYLKDKLAINDSDFNRYTSELLKPYNLQENAQASYLILAINKSDSESQQGCQYQLVAWFLDGIYDSSNPENYTKIGETPYYSLQELKPKLTQLIAENLQRVGKKGLIIEIFMADDEELLSTNFDCWECKVWRDLTQMSRIVSTFVHVRSLVRLDPNYPSMLRSAWETRWKNKDTPFIYNETIDQQARDDPECHFSQDSTVWVNLCSSDSKTLVTLWKKTRLYGIPIGIWSRCYDLEIPHRQDINTLQDLRSDAICSVMSKTRSLLISNLYILII